MDPPLLSNEHFVAFRLHVEAFEALVPVCHLADTAVAQDWGRPDEPEYHGWYGQSLHKTYSWWMYPSRQPPRAALEAWTFDWELFRDSRTIFPDRRPVYPHSRLARAPILDRLRRCQKQLRTR